VKRVSKNLFAIATGDVGSRLLGFLAAAYLARKLQPENFGLVNLALAVLGYLFLVTSPGLNLYGTRLTAERQGSEVQLAGDLLGLRLFLATLCFLVVVAAALFFSEGQTLFLLVVLYATSLFPLAVTLDWFFQGKEIMQSIGWNRFVTNLVYLSFLLLLIHGQSDVLEAPIALLLGNLAGAGLLLVTFVRNYGRFRLSWIPSSLLSGDGRWRQLLKHSLPIGLGTVTSQISFNFPLVILGLASTATTVGYFGAASRVVFALMLFDRLVTTVLLPAIARYHKRLPHDLQPMLLLTLKISLSIVLPVCFGGVVLADRLISTVYGGQFADAAPVFQSLIWYFFFSAASSVYVYGLIGIGQERIYSRMMVWGSILQMGCIAVGSFAWEAVGAGAGYALGEGVILFLMAFQFNKFFVVRFWPAVWRPLLAAVVMALVLFPMRSYALPITISTGALAFLISLVLARGITSDDIASLKAKLL